MKKTEKNRKAFQIKWLLLAVVAAVLIFMPGTVQKVSAGKLVYTVKFNNNTGTSTGKSYTALTRNVALNTTIKLPAVPRAVGYQNLGWTTKKGGKTVEYKAGASLKIKKDMKFYAVRRKSRYYTVSFYLGNGSSTAAYQKLKKKVEEGTNYTLPSVPARSGYVSLGWSTTVNGKNSTAKKTGTKIKISGNIKYYAVQMQSVSVNLYKANGTIWKTVTLGKNGYFRLPSASNASGYTFMGWSKTRRVGSSASPDYEAGELIPVSKNIKLYATVFNRTMEHDITSSEMARPAIGTKYSRVIFVGDSRTVGMSNTLKKQMSSSVLRGVSFVAEAGQGLGWLKSEGYSLLLKEIEKSKSTKPIAVVFNLGVNSLSSVNSYVSYMESIAPTLKSKNCKLFYMSVNPVNNTLIIKEKGQSASRPEALVREFNNKIRTELAADYTYIDTYSILMKKGYGTWKSYTGSDATATVDDGLHYTVKTYKRIYYYCINYLNTGRLDTNYLPY